MTNREGLKPCPFCGGAGHIRTEHDTDGFGVFLYVECHKCRARSGALYDLPELLKAIQALDKSAVMPYFVPTLQPGDPPYKQWQYAVIGFVQAHPELFPGPNP